MATDESRYGTDYIFKRGEYEKKDPPHSHEEMVRIGRRRRRAVEDVMDSIPKYGPQELQSLEQLGLRKYEEIRNPAEVMYDWEQLEQMALDAIKQYNLIHKKEVVAYLPCHYMTAVKQGFFKQESIVNALEHNKIKSKVKLRNNWQDPDAAANLQLAAFKLMADPDERQALGSYHKGEFTSTNSLQITVNFGELNPGDLENDPIEVEGRTVEELPTDEEE